MSAHVLALQRLGAEPDVGVNNASGGPSEWSGMETYTFTCTGSGGGSSAECCPVSFFAPDGDDGQLFGASTTTLAV